jgi:hypothetical protein
MADDNGEGVSHFGVSCLMVTASLDITSRQGFVRDASGSDIDLMTTLVATRVLFHLAQSRHSSDES